MYPNPTTGMMYIDLSPVAGQNLEIMVFNALSQQVLQLPVIQATGDHLRLDLQGFDSGLYTVTIIEQNGKRHSQRIVLSGL